jgi:hypothetical protein
MAVACSDTVTVPAGSFPADELAAQVPAGTWQRLSRADGSKGPRLWALIETASEGHRLLIRRSLNRNAKGERELAFFRCWSPRPVTLPELAACSAFIPGQPGPPAFHEHWSRWRRRHQATARGCHYAR